jgi:hypothetical protein
MVRASFHIRRGHGSWIVSEENGGHAIGGVFATLIAALDFVDGESRRFGEATAVIELTPRADGPIVRRAS